LFWKQNFFLRTTQDFVPIKNSDFHFLLRKLYEKKELFSEDNSGFCTNKKQRFSLFTQTFVRKKKNFILRTTQNFVPIKNSDFHFLLRKLYEKKELFSEDNSEFCTNKKHHFSLFTQKVV